MAHQLSSERSVLEMYANMVVAQVRHDLLALTTPELAVLLIINFSETPPSVQDLIERLATLRQSTVIKVLDRLYEAGLARRFSDELPWQVVLTDHGREYIRNLSKVLTGAQNELTNSAVANTT